VSLAAGVTYRAASKACKEHLSRVAEPTSTWHPPRRFLMAELASNGAAPDHELELLVPKDDVESPEFSIVIPALNEQLTIGDFIDWCHEGAAKANVAAEILIIDSSTDDTSKIALEKGARVLRAPKRGLGRAYIDALPFVRGRFLLLGDCDCTYDFREIEPFVAKFRDGAEFIMGSRFTGYIEPGAMPPLHRYLGTPVTTWILNVLFSSHFSDIHCGMRGIRRDALERMGLKSQSWEYASEMVLKSVHMKLRTSEVPIRFLRDREGRMSHHKRSGWFSPWAAAWINLRAMFVYGADFFLYRPGWVLLLLGIGLTFPIAFGPVTVGRITFSLHWMLLGVTLATLGLQSIYMGILAQVFFDYSGDRTRRWFARFPYTRTVIAAAGIFTAGLACVSALVVSYVQNQYFLSVQMAVAYLGVLGLLLMIAGFTTFTFVLLLHATAVVVWRK